MLKEQGYEEVNLNLGCPSATVTAKKKGAGFLADPDALDAFLEEIFAHSPLKISIKTRIGVEKDVYKRQQYECDAGAVYRRDAGRQKCA